MHTTQQMSIDERYFSQFDPSQKSMAASIQALTCCKQIIEEANAQSILDCGSGLSSAVFHAEFDHVVTIDDEPFWAAKTAAFIKEYIGKDITINTIDTVNQRFDFVFYDYGAIESRIFNFRKALNLCSGLMYLDDMHITYYREYVETKTRGLQLIYLPQSLDEFGRYGAIIKK